MIRAAGRASSPSGSIPLLVAGGYVAWQHSPGGFRQLWRSDSSDAPEQEDGIGEYPLTALQAVADGRVGLPFRQ